MPHSHPRMEPDTGTAYAPTDFDVDNVKSLSSSMIRPQSQSPRSPPEPSGHSSSSCADDREPLLGQSDRHDSNDSRRARVIEYTRKRSCDCGLPIIVFCRLFNTVFAACTIDKANKGVGDGWNLRIHRILFDFCWIILVWNIFSFVASVVVCTLFPNVEPDKEGFGTERGFRGKMRVQFACNDAVLGVITLVLLVAACHGIDPTWEGKFAGLMPPVVAMVASLVTIELLVAMIQPFRYSESLLFSISWSSSISQFRTTTN